MFFPQLFCMFAKYYFYLNVACHCVCFEMRDTHHARGRGHNKFRGAQSETPFYPWTGVLSHYPQPAPFFQSARTHDGRGVAPMARSNASRGVHRDHPPAEAQGVGIPIKVSCTLASFPGGFHGLLLFLAVIFDHKLPSRLIFLAVCRVALGMCDWLQKNFQRNAGCWIFYSTVTGLNWREGGGASSVTTNVPSESHRHKVVRSGYPHLLIDVTPQGVM